MKGVGTAAVLCAELAQSAEPRERLWEGAVARVPGEHLGLLRSSVAAHGGEEVESRSDRLTAAFTSVSEAVSGAVAIIQAVARLGEDRGRTMVEVRAGLHAWAPDRDGDELGRAARVAHGLCDAASSGEILASSHVR